eukprot:scaffold251_cov134-Isochrysis_galbana.AAC.9
MGAHRAGGCSGRRVRCRRLLLCSNLRLRLWDFSILIHILVAEARRCIEAGGRAWHEMPATGPRGGVVAVRSPSSTIEMRRCARDARSAGGRASARRSGGLYEHSGLANADISSLYTITDWDSPEDRGRVTQNNKEIVEESAHYYAHLARPKPSHNSETLLDALSKKGLSERQRNTLEAPLELEEIQKAMLSMAKGKSPGPDGLGAEFYHSFYALIAPRLHSMLSATRSTTSPTKLAAAG